MIGPVSTRPRDSVVLHKLRVRYPDRDKGGAMMFRRFLTALFTSSLLLFGLITPAQATAPVTIPPGTFVVDESDVLS